MNGLSRDEMNAWRDEMARDAEAELQAHEAEEDAQVQALIDAGGDVPVICHGGYGEKVEVSHDHLLPY